MKSFNIQDILLQEFQKLKPIAITNYSGLTGYEQDVLMITRSMIAYEYEVKVSRADFLKDFKKVSKHKNLQNPKSRSRFSKSSYPLAPNYFYYVVPEGLVKLSEVPPYAGMINISKTGIVTIERKAKRLHSIKVTQDRLLNILTSLSARTINGSSYIRQKHGK